jgi:hypothetical protein
MQLTFGDEFNGSHLPDAAGSPCSTVFPAISANLPQTMEKKFIWTKIFGPPLGQLSIYNRSQPEMAR